MQQLSQNGEIVNSFAPEWHSRGQRFDPAYLHQSPEKGTENRCNRKIMTVFLLICLEL